MSKDIDFDKPLSDEDRAWLHERSLDWRIQENDRKFGKEPEPSEPVSPADPAPFWEEGTEPKSVFVQRPFDPQIEGYYAGGVVVAEVEPEVEVEEVAVEDLTVEELKAELRDRELPTDGNKAELVKRLKKAL
jgi:hypothetical protein